MKQASALLFSLLLLTACGGGKGTEKADDKNKQQQKNTSLKDGSKTLKDEQEAFIKSAQGRMDELKKKFEEVKIQANSASGEAQKKLKMQASAIESALKEAETTLSELTQKSKKEFQKGKQKIDQELTGIAVKIEKTLKGEEKENPHQK